MQIDIEQLLAAQKRISPYLSRTPLVRAQGELRAWLKLETQAPTGSFKVRPAFNGMLAHLEQARARGVLASSSGNFAQAVAYAARELGVSATIVMPSITSPYKIERTRRLGAEVVISGPSFEERWETTHRLERETGRLLLHPYDSPETIAGGATLGLELCEQLEGPFCAVVPCSGGGLLAGVALALSALRPECRVVGVQPLGNASMARSLAKGERVTVGKVEGIADALVASMPGQNTFAIIKERVAEVVLVEEDEIREAMRWCAAEQKLVVEPGGAVSVAALRGRKFETAGLEPVCVLSGGNVALEKFAAFISA